MTACGVALQGAAELGFAKARGNITKVYYTDRHYMNQEKSAGAKTFGVSQAKTLRQEWLAAGALGVGVLRLRRAIRFALGPAPLRMTSIGGKFGGGTRG